MVETVRVDPLLGRKLAPDAGEVVDIGSTRVRIIVRGFETLGGFSLVEYPIPPRTLVAPMHRHTWEDEYSFVLEGQMGALLGEEIVYAEAGELIFKPRRLWHTIWNPGDAPARILEMISPGGFELFFEELAAALQRPPTDPSRRGQLGGTLRTRNRLRHLVAALRRARAHWPGDGSVRVAADQARVRSPPA